MLTKQQVAGHKAAVTKGKIERQRAALMAHWTMANGKDDAKNPYSRENYYRALTARN